MRKVNFVVGCLVLGLAYFSIAVAQDSSVKSDAPGKEDVLRFLNLMQVRDRLVQMTEGMKKGMEAGAEAGFKQRRPNATPADLKRLHVVIEPVFQDFPIDEMINAMVPIYQKHLSKSDLDAVVAFYSSPVGQRLLKEQPAMMGEAMQAGQDIMMKKLPEITNRVDAKVAELAAEEEGKKVPQ